MAKTKTHPSTALALRGLGGHGGPIVVERTRTVTRSPRGKGGKGKGKRGHHRQSTEKVLMGLAMGGFALGFIDKPGTLPANIPTIPILGKAGTIAVVAHFLGGKGRPGIVTDIRNAAAVVAAYEFGLKGSVSGDD